MPCQDTDALRRPMHLTRFCACLQTRKLELFTLKEHVNSVAPLQRGALWALLHNLGQVRPSVDKPCKHRAAAQCRGAPRRGFSSAASRAHLDVRRLQSELVRVDLQRGEVTKRLTGIGTKAHGIVAWRGSLLVLDSAAGGLLRVNPFNGSHTTLYQARMRQHKLVFGHNSCAQHGWDLANVFLFFASLLHGASRRAWLRACSRVPTWLATWQPTFQPP